MLSKGSKEERIQGRSIIQGWFCFSISLIVTVLLSGTTAENIALGKPATQLGTYGGYGPELAVDGNTDQTLAAGSCAHPFSLDSDINPSERKKPSWWSLDLLNTYIINNITIFFRCDCCYDQINRNTILVGAVKDDLTECAYISKRDSIQSFQCRETKPVRFVKIQQLYDIALGICEVIIDGYPYTGFTSTVPPTTITTTATTTTQTPRFAPTSTLKTAANDIPPSSTVKKTDPTITTPQTKNGDTNSLPVANRSSSGGLIAGIIVAVVVFIIIVAVIIFFLVRRYKRREKVAANENGERRSPQNLQSHELQGYSEIDDIQVVAGSHRELSTHDQQDQVYEEIDDIQNAAKHSDTVAHPNQKRLQFPPNSDSSYYNCVPPNAIIGKRNSGNLGQITSEGTINNPATDGNILSQYQSLHGPGPSYQPLVLKSGGLLPYIKVTDLRKHIQLMTENDEAFHEEFKKLPSGPIAEWNVGSLPENRTKNRFLEMKAYDHTRVVLGRDISYLDKPSGGPVSDYINANYISGHGGDEKVYIAAQGPLQTTVNDMWQMIWETNSKRIVMFAEINEEGKIKYDSYWPEAGSTIYGNFKIVLVETEKHESFVMRTFMMKFEGKSRLVHQFHFTGWPEGGPIPKASTMLDFRNIVQTVEEEGGPLIVHCSSGVGRTGTYIAIDRCLQQAAQDGVVNVWGTVYQLRTERINMVETLDQYKFIHEVLQHYSASMRCEMEKGSSAIC